MAFRKSTEAAAILEQTWENEIIPAATEEMRVVNNFRESTVTGKFGNTLNISKLPSVGASTLTSTATGASLTSTDPTALNVTASPTFAYAAIYFPENTLTDLLRDASLRNGFRTQLAAALATNIDASGGTLAASVSGVAGGAAEHLTKPTMLDAMGTLAAQVKNLWQPGKKNMYLCMHPSEIKHILAIPEVTAANLRGDSQNPNVKGFVWDAWGIQINESGNVYQAAGVNHNLLHVPEAFVIAYNQRPKFLPMQYDELQVRMITFTSYAVAEVFDEYALDFQTAA